MSVRIEEALADCLERMEKGEATLEEALNLYPRLKAELRPLLLLAAELRGMPRVAAPASLRGAGRPVFQQRAQKVSPATSGPGRLLRFPFAGGPRLGWIGQLGTAAAVVGIVVLGMSGTIVASANSVPEEPLYPVKLAVESAQLSLAPDDASRADLELRFAARRVAEAETVAQQDRPQAVSTAVALYEQKVDSAIKASRTAVAAPAAPAEPDRVQETLRQNVQALQQVQQKVKSDTARAAIASAIERSVVASARSREADNREKDAPGRPTEMPAMALQSPPTPTPPPTKAPSVALPPLPTAAPRATRESPDDGSRHADVPPGQAEKGNQAARPATSQSAGPDGRNDAADERDDDRDRQQARGQSGQSVASVGRSRAEDVVTTHTPTVTPAATMTAAPSATARAATATPTSTAAPANTVPDDPRSRRGAAAQGRDQDQNDDERVKGADRGSKFAATPTATPETGSGRDQSGSRDRRSDSRSIGNQRGDLLSGILDELRGLVGRR